MTKLSTILLALVFFAPRVFSQSVIKGASLENKEVRQYSKAEWDITLTAAWQKAHRTLLLCRWRQRIQVPLEGPFPATRERKIQIPLCAKTKRPHHHSGY